MLSSKGRYSSAPVFTIESGSKVAVSDAHTYAYRDPKLKHFTATEFKRAFNMRKMTKADESWYSAQSANETPDPTRRGRPVQRYMLLHPHPLRDSHLLVRRKKNKILTFLGQPPPLPPCTSPGAAAPAGLLAGATARRRRAATRARRSRPCAPIRWSETDLRLD